ncbi:MAG: BspA family leucine-rich repeat surface protein [Firmicutes bacterium]|nr:BspA family leucine-rich repeat surface protein [Bacillota bacterium]MDY5586192.1 BspA family leucine-rich repeat surface protein [Eubacteriales bacterium]
MFSKALDANRLTNLTSISFGNFNTSNVTDMHYMFEGCSSLTSINLSSFDMSKVTNTDSMLANCSGLTEIKTPKAIGSAAVDLPTKTGYSWVDKNNTSTKYTQINSTNVGKTLILKAN